MKKTLKVTALILAITLTFSLAGCFKKPITTDAFQEIMEDKDFDVTEGSSEAYAYIGNDFDIDEVFFATESDPNITLIFIVFGSTDDAKDYFDTSVEYEKELIEDEDLDVKTTLKNSGNYSKFTEKGETDYGYNAYTIFSRIDNTVLILLIEGDSKSDVDEAEAIASKLGY